MTTDTKAKVIAALEANGYSATDIVSASFVKMLDTKMELHKITFLNGDDEWESGSVYLEQNADGVWLGEF